MSCKCKDGCEGAEFIVIRGRFPVQVGCDCTHHQDDYETERAKEVK